MSRAEYRRSNDHFIFHNENPKNRLGAQDCVIRALAYANDTYEIVLDDLCRIAKQLYDSPTSERVFEAYLREKGWVKQRQPRKDDGTKYRVEEWARLNTNGLIIITMSGHLSVIDGDHIIDTWDCGDIILGNYWTKGVK